MSEQVATQATSKAIGLRQIVPLTHVADVNRSVEFYKLLGFEGKNRVESEGHLQWAWLQNGTAELMIARSVRSGNPDAQGVLFYLYTPDVVSYRGQLQDWGVKVGPLQYPFYSPRGEFRIDDPDGYALFVTHAD